VSVLRTEKYFSDGEHTENINFSDIIFLCVFSERSPLEKYFSDGIHIFLCVFARTEECEFPAVVNLLTAAGRVDATNLVPA
jgi:hypothetical protein